MLNPKPGPCYNPNMQINQMRNNNDPYAEHKTTQSQMLNPEADPCYNLNMLKHTMRNNAQ